MTTPLTPDAVPALAKPKRRRMWLLCSALAVGSVMTGGRLGVGLLQIGGYWAAAAAVIAFRLRSLGEPPTVRLAPWLAAALGLAVALWIAVLSFVVLTWEGLSLCNDDFDHSSGEDCF